MQSSKLQMSCDPACNITLFNSYLIQMHMLCEQGFTVDWKKTGQQVVYLVQVRVPLAAKGASCSECRWGPPGVSKSLGGQSIYNVHAARSLLSHLYDIRRALKS